MNKILSEKAWSNKRILFMLSPDSDMFYMYVLKEKNDDENIYYLVLSVDSIGEIITVFDDHVHFQTNDISEVTDKLIDKIYSYFGTEALPFSGFVGSTYILNKLNDTFNLKYKKHNEKKNHYNNDKLYSFLLEPTDSPEEYFY